MSKGRPATKIEVDLASSICRQQDEIHNLRERIKDLEAELVQHRWIPVTERLPENIATVFILTAEGVGGLGFYSEGEKRWERLDYAINLNITHWKPILS